MSFVVRQLTAAGAGAVAVLELVGAGALEGVRALAAGDRLTPGDLRLVQLRSGAELLDEALCWAQTPEHVELHLHGSPAVVRRVTAELMALGGREPEPARTLEERAEACLASAASEAAARILLDQAQGALRRELELLRAGATDERLVDTGRLRELLARGRVMARLCKPPRVVLAGPVNAGKSTLFNVLVGHERVVVDDEGGTTRDAISERVRLGAYAVDLVDTAGERELERGGQQVERAGQRLGRELRQGADLVLWLDPLASVAAPESRSGSGTRTGKGRVRVLGSRADAASGSGGERISALERPDEAREVVERVFLEALELPREPFEPGAAVPFEEDQVAVLEGLLAGADMSFGARLESMLAR